MLRSKSIRAYRGQSRQIETIECDPDKLQWWGESPHQLDDGDKIEYILYKIYMGYNYALRVGTVLYRSCLDLDEIAYFS